MQCQVEGESTFLKAPLHMLLSSQGPTNENATSAALFGNSISPMIIKSVLIQLNLCHWLRNQNAASPLHSEVWRRQPQNKVKSLCGTERSDWLDKRGSAGPTDKLELPSTP